jgi:hypothetical protein
MPVPSSMTASLAAPSWRQSQEIAVCSARTALFRARLYRTKPVVAVAKPVLPNNSFKPNPLRGLIQVLGGTRHDPAVDSQIRAHLPSADTARFSASS